VPTSRTDVMPDRTLDAPEVARQQPAPDTGEPPALNRARPGQLSVWLFVIAAVVLVMIVVGGTTRLTQSGLSMVNWEPVGGVVPPLSEADWNAEFDAYKTSPSSRRSMPT
jgi:cytochrome c oxidase assembly protein subunit 15